MRKMVYAIIFLLLPLFVMSETRSYDTSMNVTINAPQNFTVKVEGHDYMFSCQNNQTVNNNYQITREIDYADAVSVIGITNLSNTCSKLAGQYSETMAQNNKILEFFYDSKNYSEMYQDCSTTLSAVNERWIILKNSSETLEVCKNDLENCRNEKNSCITQKSVMVSKEDYNAEIQKLKSSKTSTMFVSALGGAGLCWLGLSWSSKKKGEQKIYKDKPEEDTSLD